MGRSGRGRSRRKEPSLFGTQTSKVWSLEGNSLDEDSRVVQRKTVREEFKIILKFRKEDENVQSSPIALTR